MTATGYSGFIELMEERQPPCLSLYQPTHRQFPASQQNPIRYKNLLSELKSLLQARYAGTDAKMLLAPFEQLLDDAQFWKHPRDGLAALGAPGFFRVYRLQRPVPELVSVGESLHLKPLVRILQTTDAYQVLALDRDRIRLYEGNRDALDPVELAPGVPATVTEALGPELTEPYSKVSSQRAGFGSPMHHGHGAKAEEVEIDIERFFHVVDKAVLEHHSRPSGRPLLLAALPEYQGDFRRLSRNPFLLKQGLETNPFALDADELRQRAWFVIEPHHHARTLQIANNFRAGKAKGLASANLNEIASAAVEGRVAALMVEAERRVGGHFDRRNGLIELADPQQPANDDVLDDIAVEVLRRKGEIDVVPREQMPAETGLAAIYRY